MTAVQKRIQEITERLDKATPGEWKVGHSCGSVVSDKPGGEMLYGTASPDAVEYYGGYLIGESIGEANREFIAKAKSDIQFLLSLARSTDSDNLTISIDTSKTWFHRADRDRRLAETLRNIAQHIEKGLTVNKDVILDGYSEVCGTISMPLTKPSRD